MFHTLGIEETWIQLVCCVGDEAYQWKEDLTELPDLEGLYVLSSPMESQPPVTILQVNRSSFLQKCHYHIRMTLLSSTEQGSVLVLVEGIQLGGGLVQGRWQVIEKRSRGMKDKGVKGSESCVWGWRTCQHNT